MIAVLILAALVGAVSSEHYHIVPVDSTALCQHYPNGTCFTLDQLLSQISHTGNIIISFLPGEHLLTWNMTFINRNNVTLNSEQLDNLSNNAPRITCALNTGIKVRDTDTFTFRELVMHGCERQYGEKYDGGGAIQLLRSNAVVTNSVFRNNSAMCDKCIGGALSLNYGSIMMDSCVFEYNMANYHGGAVVILSGTLHTTNSVFEHNTVSFTAGAVYVWNGFVKVENSTFYQNMAYAGGAIVAQNGTLHITNSKFSYQNVAIAGGAIVAHKGTLHITKSKFECNKANNTAGAVGIQDTTLIITRSRFDSNTAQSGAGAVLTNGGSVCIINTTFEHNSAGELGGGAVYSAEGEANITNSIFQYNSANKGGALYALRGPMDITNTTFNYNYANHDGGAVYFDTSIVTFKKDSKTEFHGNTGDTGGAIYLRQTTLYGHGDVWVTSNIAMFRGGGIFATQSAVILENKMETTELKITTNLMLASNNTSYQDGGGVFLSSSSWQLFCSTLHIDSNTAQNNGGGMSMNGKSSIQIRSGYNSHPENIFFNLTSNFAKKGGAIYVSDETGGEDICRLNVLCFINMLSQLFIEPIIGNDSFLLTYFDNNTAVEAGSDIYGGLLDRCINTFPSSSPGYTGIKYLKDTAQFSWAPEVTDCTLNRTFHKVMSTTQFFHHISSDPVRVCFCENNIVTCDYIHPIVFKKKGETFTLSVAAVDQVGKPVNATIISSLPRSKNGRLKAGQQFRSVGDQCTELEYNVYSSGSSALLQLYAEGPCGNLGISKQEVNITFKPCMCPIGLQCYPPLIDCVCDCDKSLKQSMKISNCSPQNGTIQINNNLWIEYINNTNATSHFVTHSCPFDYCVQKPVNISLANQTEADKQCAFDRTGRLCGQCKEGLSLVFASSICQQCSNYYLFLLLLFALAGIALVAFILLLNITVATGTIHGLLFYANILAANRSILLPFDTSNFLTVFISWLNLDLGIETCFYNGMDSYGKFLLQLVFPAYVFLLIAIIMVLCNRSQRIASLFGKKNPEATLYTLILLSYSKLIRIIITALQFAPISYPDGQKLFWLYDANVVYFTISHIPRFLAAFIITILGAVYTTLLLFGQLFNRCSEYRLMKWTTHRYYIHFLKAHHAPLSDKHRYWVGLLLLAKLVHYLISAFADDSVVILSVGILAFVLLLLKQNKQIYNKASNELLETLFITNIVVFALSTFYVENSSRDTPYGQQALAMVSMSVSFIAFLGIVLYHILDTCGVKLGELSNEVLAKLRERQHYQPVAIIEEQLEDDDEHLVRLDNSDNQLREPALDDLIPVRPEDYNIPLAPPPQCREPRFIEIDIWTRDK